MKNVMIQDYHAGMEIVDTEAETEEQINGKLLNLLAKAVTHADELSDTARDLIYNSDFSEEDKQRFSQRLGEFLDMLDNPAVADFLDRMRKTSRCPFKRYGVT